MYLCGCGDLFTAQVRNRTQRATSAFLNLFWSLSGFHHHQDFKLLFLITRMLVSLCARLCARRLPWGLGLCGAGVTDGVTLSGTRNQVCELSAAEPPLQPLPSPCPLLRCQHLTLRFCMCRTVCVHVVWTCVRTHGCVHMCIYLQFSTLFIYNSRLSLTLSEIH